MNESSRPLLILDIDETLLHAAEHQLKRQCDFRAGDYFVYLRPFAKEFLDTTGDTYELACWSSATIQYLDLVLRELFSQSKHSLRFVWDRSRCVVTNDPSRGDQFYLKDLSKVKRLGYKLERVLILEDEARKVSRNYGNAIYVNPFLGNAEDYELKSLARYLKRIHAVPDFRKMEKRSWRTTEE